MSPLPSPLSVATYNIHKAVGTDGRFDPARICAVMDELDADIIAIQEIDRRRGVKEGVLDLDDIRRRTGHQLVPVAQFPGLQGFRGNGLFHRRGSVRSTDAIALPSEGPNGAILTDARGAIIVEFEIDDEPLRVIATHLGLLRRWRTRQTAALLSALHHSHSPTVLMGDTNEWRPGRGACPITSLEPFFGHISPALKSFPSRLPIFPLDRILSRPHHALEQIAVHTSPLARVASDHLPVRAVINLGSTGD